MDLLLKGSFKDARIFYEVVRLVLRKNFKWFLKYLFLFSVLKLKLDSIIVIIYG